MGVVGDPLFESYSARYLPAGFLHMAYLVMTAT